MRRSSRDGVVTLQNSLSALSLDIELLEGAMKQCTYAEGKPEDSRLRCVREVA